MNNNKIYVISVFEKMDTKASPLFQGDKLVADIGCSVVNGWYLKKEDAEHIIKNNITDIWETCYDYAVLEECNEGMYDFGRERTYYKYNTETHKYIEMDIKDIPEIFLSQTFSISNIGL